MIAVKEMKNHGFGLKSHYHTLAYQKQNGTIPKNPEAFHSIQ
jgi:hypothetical protein